MVYKEVLPTRGYQAPYLRLFILNKYTVPMEFERLILVEIRVKPFTLFFLLHRFGGYLPY